MKQEFRYESTYDSSKKQDIQEAVEFILSKDYGEVIPFEQLSKILHYNLELEKENRKFRSVMARIKNFLIDYGYILKTITNVGYYILKPKQIASYTYRTYIERPLNLFNKAERIPEHVDETELTNIRKQERNQVQDLNTTVKDIVEDIIHSSEYYRNKEQYDNMQD